MTNNLGRYRSNAIRFIGLIYLLTLALFANAQSARQQKPNVVFILIDDLGWRDVGAFGTSFYETPNIDKLASEGMKFTNAYAACPVCSPTRASILTGKYPARLQATDWFGAPQPDEASKDANWGKKKLLPASYIENLPLEENNMAETFKASGYKTFIAGKWHLGETQMYWPENQGFDINKGGYSSGHPSSYFSPYNNIKLDDGPPGEYLGDRLANETVEFIEQNKDRPFFAYFPMYEVHTPIQAKDSLIKKYTAKRNRLGLKDDFLVTDRARTRAVQSMPAYAAMVESMDHAVGTVLNKIKSLGLEKNTIVVFFSDNGGLSTAEGSPTCNFPLKGGKGWLYEGGIREPLIIKQTGVTKPGSRSDVPVISTDFYPTLLSMCGIEALPKQTLDGINITPAFSNKKIDRETMFWHYPHYGNQGGTPGSAIRKGKYKLIQWFEDHSVELYDLSKDIGEKNDLATQKPDIAKELLSLLNDWRKSVNAAMPVINPYQNDTGYLRPVIVELKKNWPTNKMINLVFHGHSVPSGYFKTPAVHTFESYPMLVLKGLTEKYSTAVINSIRSTIGGENSEQGLRRFDSTSLKYQPDVLIIDYALNDRKMGLERTRAAWEETIKKALAKKLKIVLLTPTPDLNEDIKSDAAVLQQYRDMIIGLGKKYKLPVIDSYNLFKQKALAGEDISNYMSQKNHPNEKGHQLVADEILKLFGVN